MSVLPDLDAMVGLLAGNLERFHNARTHSLFVGLAVALLFGAIAFWKGSSWLPFWSLLTLTCYEMHVMMDFSTVGRGVMLFWPFSTERFSSALKLFYGLHWSDGWQSLRHVWTLFTELGFVAVTGAVVYLLPKCVRGIIRRYLGKTT
jgi:membrane-bound metal-dependent hydrolase YbcI (DUF457 family)